MEGGYQGKWEKRWHPLRQEWVVYAAHRNNRPWSFDRKNHSREAPTFDPGCYLCPGNHRISGQQNPDYKQVYIFENDHPVVGMQAPALPAYHDHHGFYRKGEAKGIAKVVCYDPRHNVTLTDMDVKDIAAVFRALRDEMIFFSSIPLYNQSSSLKTKVKLWVSPIPIRTARSMPQILFSTCFVKS